MTDLHSLSDSYTNILLGSTPKAWVNKALDSIDTLLIDHANCEKKAASTAMSLMFRYTDNIDLQNKMSRLAREELRHFEQVLVLMTKRDITYTTLTASRYAESLRKHVRKAEPYKLTDMLIIGALIEARSCERFASLAPYLEAKDPDLARYYFRLCKSEERHFQDYLHLAKSHTTEAEIVERIHFFAKIEQTSIESFDVQFRFHSGVPNQ